MKSLLSMVAIILLSTTTIAQVKNNESELEKITETLMNYIEGTANGEPDKLRKAFHKDFNLYTVSDKDSLKIRNGEQYIANTKQGEKSNRIGRILSIDIEKDAATAKAEILIPKWRIFTDYFLLLKYEGAWKIVHKSYTWREIPKPNSKVLFITSNQHTYGNTNINTSNHFSEIVVAYDVFIKNGYTVDFVSPKGGAIPIGYIETSDTTQKRYLYDNNFMNMLKTTHKPTEINIADYQAVYYSGGGSAMFGVAENEEIQNIATKVYEKGGIVSAVCHGTAGIVNLKDSNSISIFKNKKITGFPDFFENKKADYYKTFPFSIDETIIKKGGNFVYSKKEKDNFYVVDGKVITGQDPSATRSVALKVIEVLQKLNSKN
jgi:putative intracellular protease/amidase